VKASVSERWGLALIALAAVLVRLPPAALIHLTEDESYYRLWAQHLAFGYYDHPPMIAWWIAAGVRLAGDTALGVRLLPVLATGLTTWFVGDLARTLSADPRTGLRAALWWNATLTIGLGGMLALPDTAAGLFWILTLWLIVRAGAGGAGWWLAAGLAAGLGALSKYSALFLAPGVLSWLAIGPDRRRALASWGPWAACAIAAAVFAPNIVWNAQHHWYAFAKQFGRADAGGQLSFRLLEFLATQFVLFNPVLAVFAARGAVWSLRATSGETGRALALPVISSAPFAVYLLIHSLHDRVQGHWPVPLYGPLAVCAAVYARDWPSRGRRLWLSLGPALGLGAAILALVHMAEPGVPPLGRADPAGPLQGWPGFADRVEAARRGTGAAWVGTLSYGLDAQLQGESRIAAPVLQVTERRRYPPEFTPPESLTRPGLLVELERRIDLADLRLCFGSVERAGGLVRGVPGGPQARYALYLVSAPKRDLWRDGCHMPKEVIPRLWGLR
jgi:4-amino-4-deoxy-L-arabinose transferase-like glycosyltransferase